MVGSFVAAAGGAFPAATGAGPCPTTPWYHRAMESATRNRLIVGGSVAVVTAMVAYHMFFSLTPPRHADHDHAMATLDAGGFLWIRAIDGARRNLVGRPGRVLVIHWFDPEGDVGTELEAAAAFAAATAADPRLEVILVGRAASHEALAGWAEEAGLPAGLVYVDEGGRTAELIGVRRYPETLIYDPAGRLAHQARGPAGWSEVEFRALLERAGAGLGEVG